MLSQTFMLALVALLLIATKIFYRQENQTPKDDVNHLGEECWQSCNERQGPCPSFCGSGLCCRAGWRDARDGCLGLGVSDIKKHVCVPAQKPGVKDFLVRLPAEKPGIKDFLERVFSNLPDAATDFNFKSWRFDGRPTNEGVGIMSITGFDVDKLAASIFAVGEFPGNIDYVEETRVIPDPKYKPPKAIHYYQRLKLPLLSPMHNEIVLFDFGQRNGWRVLGWQQLDDETERLSPNKAARFEYNVGAWLIKPDAVAFATSSSPRKSDVSAFQYAIITKGGDATAKAAVKVNINGMVAWSRR